MKVGSLTLLRAIMLVTVLCLCASFFAWKVGQISAYRGTCRH